MIKTFDLVRRRDSIASEDFGPVWLARARSLAAAAPEGVAPLGWLQYVVRVSKRPTDVDGISATWFHDEGHRDRFLDWCETAAEPTDPTDVAARQTIRVRQRIVSGPEYIQRVRTDTSDSVLLLFALLQRIPAQTRQGYADYWWNTHRVLADQEVPAEFAMDGYLHNYIDAADPCAWDGIGEIYEASLDAARTRTTWVEGPGGQVIRDDEDNFLRKDTRRVYVTAQHVVVPVASMTMV